MTGGINMTKDIIPVPSINKTATGYTFYWLEPELQDIAIEISRIKENSRTSSIECEIEVAVDGRRYEQEDYVSLITSVRTNLLSISARNTLVKTIKDSCISDDLLYYDWGQIVNKISSMVVRDIRKTSKLIILDGSYGKEPPGYLIYPLVVKDAPNIFYADRSSAKTLFASLLGIFLTIPSIESNIGINITDEKEHKVLFLDWENNENITDWQKECLIRGFDIHYCEFYYLRCTRPVYEMIDDILIAVEKTGSDVVIIDSLGVAVGADLNLTEPAFLFWNAVRQIKATPIILGHTAKDPNSKRKTVYGNAYYENEARNIWEIVKDQQPGSNELNITTHHRKPPPYSGFHEPLAYRFIFENDITYVEPGTVTSDQRNGSGISEEELVKCAVLESSTPVLPADVFNILDKSVPIGNIKAYLNRLKTKGVIERCDTGYRKR